MSVGAYRQTPDVRCGDIQWTANADEHQTVRPRSPGVWRYAPTVRMDTYRVIGLDIRGFMGRAVD